MTEVESANRGRSAVETALIENANFGKVTLEEITHVNGIYLAIPFSVALLGLAFFVLKDRYA